MWSSQSIWLETETEFACSPRAFAISAIMAPPTDETPENVFSKAVLAARAWAEKNNIELSKRSGDALKNMPADLRSKVRNDLGWRMNDSINDKYTNLKTDADRRAFMAQYVICPDSATNEGVNETFAVTDQLAKKKWRVAPHQQNRRAQVFERHGLGASHGRQWRLR